MFNQTPYRIKVGIYLPKRYLYYTVKHRYLYKKCYQKVVDYFTLKYGGCTRIKAIGSYKERNSADVAYNIHEQFIYAYIPDNCLNEKELYDLCSQCCKILKQDSIAIEINNEMYFISGNEYREKNN